MRLPLKTVVPFESYTIQTSLKPVTIQHRLTETVEPREQYSRYSKEYAAGAYKPYMGDIKENYFEVMRITRHQTIFQPVIKGEIQANKTGSLIRVKIFPHPIAYALSLGVIILSIIILPDFFAVLAIIALCYVIIMGWFKLELTTSKEFIEKLLK
ncbi:MAG: hypothetical protein GY797_27130 [Deltaproteobacteria bacterium]|nr:hypothetical protein [Deltaproteobacteria bacterium]